MLTLTYPGKFPDDGKIVKDHWRRMRQWLARQGCDVGLWFLEFQRRGAPHFHAFMRNPVPATKVAMAWFKIVGSGNVAHLKAGTRVEWLRKPDAAGAYASKYASKIHQKEVPQEFGNVGRFWGTWGRPEIWNVYWLAWETGKAFVRSVRRAYEHQRKTWTHAKRWKDSGIWGFTAYETGAAAWQLLRWFDSETALPP
ncbi:MAG: hypothetical protein AB1450_03880 [Pseudomonadota bacterium]